MAITLPPDQSIEQKDLDFAALQQVIPGSAVYFTEGNGEEFEDIVTDSDVILGLITDKTFIPLGELAEKPGKIDSKSEKLKTKNYLIPGRRTSTIELTICGLSGLQKQYLESSLFQGVAMTMLLSDKVIENIEPEIDDIQLVVLKGLSWVVDWSGEADGLWTVVISSEVQGRSAEIIYPKLVPHKEEE